MKIWKFNLILGFKYGFRFVFYIFKKKITKFKARGSHQGRQNWWLNGIESSLKPHTKNNPVRYLLLNLIQKKHHFTPKSIKMLNGEKISFVKKIQPFKN